MPRPHITPRGRPGTQFIRGWVGPRASLDGRKISSPTRIRSQTVQPIVSCYTNWATRATYIYIYIYKLEQSAYPPMHVIRLHNGIVLFLASQPSSDWVNLSLFQGPLLYQWDALLQLCQVVSILKQRSVLAAQVIKTLIIWDILLCTVAHRNKESGGPCCF